MEHHDQPPWRIPLVRTAVVITAFGCLAIVIAHISAILMAEDHDLLADTVSALAIGNDAWVQDAGLNAAAGGIAALATAILASGVRRKITVAGVIALFVTALSMVIIAEYHEYMGYGDSGDPSIHDTMVGIMFIAFSAAMLLLAPRLGDHRKLYRTISLTAGIVLAIGGLLFQFVIPDSLLGITERILATDMIGWTALGAYLWWRRPAPTVGHSTS